MYIEKNLFIAFIEPYFLKIINIPQKSVAPILYLQYLQSQFF